MRFCRPNQQVGKSAILVLEPPRSLEKRAKTSRDGCNSNFYGRGGNGCMMVSEGVGQVLA